LSIGTLAFDGEARQWLVKAQPHVAIRVKRLFEKAAQFTAGEIKLADSLENCRELRWFLERYELEISATDRCRLDVRAEQHRERESLVEQMLAGLIAPRAFELAIPPRDYQRVGADLWIRMGGLLLADDTGIGKTCSAICALTDPRLRPACVVTLTHLMGQWRDQLQKFAPALTTHVVKGAQPYDIAAPKKTRGGQLSLPGSFPDVVILCYSRLAGWSTTLAPLVSSVVYDEIQELRTGDASNKGSAAYEISGAVGWRLGLSATPIYNYGSEIYNVLRAVAPPDTIGTKEEFHREHCGATDARGRANLKDPKAFGTWLRSAGLMLRRTRKEVGRELPEVIRISHEIECDAAPLKEISGAAEQLAQMIVDRNGSQFDRMKAAGDFDMMMRHATGVAKAPYVAEFVRMLVTGNDEPVVLFGWHRDVYSIWMERLADLNPVLYTGSESATQKAEAGRRFIEGESKLLIMSLRSGAGLDGLQAVPNAVVVFGELDWSPGVHSQCTDRVDRDGKREPTVVYYLLSDSGSDPAMADVLGVKRGQSEGLRNPQQDLIEKLDRTGERVRTLAEQYLAKGRKKASAA
jgi:SNF2 family DNA or RNA helicase